MKARYVYESVKFQRGGDPKGVMGIGLYGELIDLLHNGEYREWLQDMLDDDRDGNVRMWKSGIDALVEDGTLPGDYEYVGDIGMLKWDWPAIPELLTKIISISDPSQTIEGKFSPDPSGVPEWWMKEFKAGELVGDYKLYNTGVLLVDNAAVLLDKELFNL